MNLYISHQSALAYWQSARARRGRPLAESDYPNALTPTRDALDIPWLAELGIDTSPLHVTVPEKRQVEQRDGLVVHLASTPAVPKSYEYLVKGVYVASPELCFCQVATSLSLIELVKLGYELCAGFRPEETDIRGFEGRDPLTAPESLLEFARRYSGNGAKRARVAASYIRGHAASPAEISAAMLLTLPRRYGGAGLPPCRMNHPITVPKAGPRSEITYFGDLVWPEKRVILEYDGALFHQGAEQMQADALRRNALLGTGWRVFTMTSKQLHSLAEFRILVEQLARTLRAQNSHKTPGAAEAQFALRKLLLT